MGIIQIHVLVFLVSLTKIDSDAPTQMVMDTVIQVHYIPLNHGLFQMVLMLFGGHLKTLLYKIYVEYIAILNGVILMEMV